MNEYIAARAQEIGNFIAKSHCTVREAAKKFCVSKSTAHKDCSERLKEIDRDLYERVHKVLSDNFSVRHLRGGAATKRKYQMKKQREKIFRS